MHNNSNHTWKSFADAMDQASRAEGERAPSNGERADHQAYERAIVMKSGVGCGGQISAQAEAAEEGEERRRNRRRIAGMIERKSTAEWDSAFVPRAAQR